MAGELRFEVDAMLVKLAHYLRVIGSDAECRPEVSLATRIDRADAEDRVFLTRSRQIGHQERRPKQMLVLEPEDAVEQLHAVAAAFALDPAAELFSRCIRCNVELAAIAKDEALVARVPPRVLEAYRTFWTCPKCGTVFWKGSHVRNTCRKLRLPDASEPDAGQPGFALGPLQDMKPPARFERFS